MQINRQVLVFDAADLAAESSFWAGVLDGTVDAEDDWHMVIVEGEPRVGVQLAHQPRPARLARRDTGAADPSRPVGRRLRGRTRSCHVAGCESAQACSRRGLRRQLPGLRGSSRAPLLPVLDSSRLTKSRGARLDRRVGATALRARLASTGRVPLLAPLNESDAAVCGGFGDPAVAHERRPRSRDPQPATLNPELRRVEGWVGPRPGCRQRITGRLSVAGFMRSVGVSTSFSQG
jgi:hypothetical protein